MVNPYLGKNVTNTLRQVHSEAEDDERFQADLMKAVQQSLGKTQLLLHASTYIYLIAFLLVGSRYIF